MNTFQTFEQLQNNNKNTNLIEIIREITNTFRDENSSEERMFSSITELRKLLKYDESAFKISFDNIHNRLIKKTLYNPNKNISNELIIYTLIFFGEVFNFQNDDINIIFPEDWISDLYWPILKYISHEDERIKTTSRKAIFNLCVNIYVTKKISVLFDTFEDCDVETGKFIYEMFNNFINDIDPINFIYLFDWNFIFGEINCDIDNNSQEFIFLKQVFQLIKEKLNENFNVFYNTLNDKSKNVLNHFLK
jgi:hypothetical protein